MIRALLVSAFIVSAPVVAGPAVPPLRDRAAAQDALTRTRLDQVVPRMMRAAGVDMWIIVAREYAEDPVARAMLPATWASARRRTVLIFHDRGGEAGVERLAMARYPVGTLFQSAWNPEQQPDQWAAIGALVRARDPRRIAVNVSDDHALADGMTASQLAQLKAALGPLVGRIVSDHRLALGFLETRTPQDMAAYGGIMRVAHDLLSRGLSEEAVVPGVTTTQDLVWWYRERLADLRQDVWCQPSVSVQRAGVAAAAPGRQTLPDDAVIRPGDLIHVDFCAGMMGLKTDTQMMAYVLRPGETAVPAGLAAGWADILKVQDALTGAFANGLTGDGVLAEARRRAVAAGTRPVIYTHAIGVHGHGAGPWIGAWENQQGVPGGGALTVNPDTAWSIELAALKPVPEWGGQTVRFAAEVDGFWDGRSFGWIDGRQATILTIPRQPGLR